MTTQSTSRASADNTKTPSEIRALELLIDTHRWHYNEYECDMLAAYDLGKKHGYEQGKKEGYDKGYEEGYAVGL